MADGVTSGPSTATPAQQGPACGPVAARCQWLDYKQLTRDIMQRVSCTPEKHYQRFRTLTLEEMGLPFAFGQQLQGTLEWVKCHHPASLDQADEMAEDHLAAVPLIGRQRPSLLLYPSFPRLSVPSTRNPPVPAPQTHSPATHPMNPWGRPLPFPLCFCVFSFPGG